MSKSTNQRYEIYRISEESSVFSLSDRPSTTIRPDLFYSGAGDTLPVPQATHFSHQTTLSIDESAVEHGMTSTTSLLQHTSSQIKIVKKFLQKCCTRTDVFDE